MTLMVASTLCFGTMAVLIRIASKSMHPFEIAFFRSFFGALAAAPLLWRDGWRTLRTDRLGFYTLRCAIGTVSMLAGFWAIAHLPLAQAIALSYSSPLFVTVGAVLFLGEVVRARRWSAVVAGFVGVLVIVRPGTDGFTAANAVDRGVPGRHVVDPSMEGHHHERLLSRPCGARDAARCDARPGRRAEDRSRQRTGRCGR